MSLNGKLEIPLRINGLTRYKLSSHNNATKGLHRICLTVEIEDSGWPFQYATFAALPKPRTGAV